MKHPNLNEEKKLWTPTHPPLSHRKRWVPKGFKRVAGLDEAGRGALGGPVVAAAAMIKCKIAMQNLKLLKEIRDSKKLSPKKREEFYKIIAENPAVEWGIGRVSEKVIDKINILEATKQAMIKAVRNLEEKIGRKVDFLLIDGNFTIPYSRNSPGRTCPVRCQLSNGVNIPERKRGCAVRMPQKSIIKADEKVFSCTVASILAKVTRDRIMLKFHKKYPRYNFDRHKGYPTKLHRAMLKKYGPCEIHRKSFKPLKRSN